MITTIHYAFSNAYVCGSAVVFDVGTKKYGQRWACVDLADWPAISQYRWKATRRKKLYYARAAVDGADTLLHRLIANPHRLLVTDHKDGNGLNNRRSNLREVTPAENTIFGADRRRGGRRIVTIVPSAPHRVKKRLADGTVKEYEYPTRSKKGTKRVVTVEDRF